MAVSPPKPYCHTNKETNVWQSVHPSLTVIQIKRQMYDSQSTQALLITVIQIRDKCMAVSSPKNIVG